MIQCNSLDKALRVPGVILIEAGSPVIAYQQGDALPSHCVIPLDSGIPQEVTMCQARLALQQAGKLSSVQAAINGMTDPQKTQTQIWWDYATKVERSHPLVAQLGAAIGLAPADIDALFIAAAAW